MQILSHKFLLKLTIYFEENVEINIKISLIFSCLDIPFVVSIFLKKLFHTIASNDPFHRGCHSGNSKYVF